MKKLNIVVSAISILVIVGIVSCLTTSQETSVASQPKNVILFIGDGMGVAQVTAAITAAGAPLHIEGMPVTGLSKTSSADRYITDSAAGGTALSTGVKTRNGMIGMSPDSTIIENIVEIAKRNGLSTGVVSTSSVTHATPASFVAHVISRNNYEDIAQFFLKGNVDVFMGGGAGNFINRKDSVNLFKKLEEAGFAVATSPEGLSEIKSGKLAGLFYDGHMPPASEGRTVSLAAMTKKAVELLSKNEKGFFLMVEGSMIDWAGHDRNADYSISETIDLDQAVGEAIAFAEKNGNTLVVVTADHETGGMALTGGNIQNRIVRAEYPTSDHTAVMVPVFAYGAGSEKFGGIMENTEIFERMIWSLGVK